MHNHAAHPTVSTPQRRWPQNANSPSDDPKTRYCDGRPSCFAIDAMRDRSIGVANTRAHVDTGVEPYAKLSREYSCCMPAWIWWYTHGQQTRHLYRNPRTQSHCHTPGAARGMHGTAETVVARRCRRIFWPAAAPLAHAATSTGCGRPAAVMALYPRYWHPSTSMVCGHMVYRQCTNNLTT